MFERVGQWLRAYAEKDGRGYPDWATRYVPVVKRLRKGANLAVATIVEIGANENGLSRFATARVIVSDIDIKHLRAARRTQSVLCVAADIAALPFRAGAINVCVCMDTFEHVPREDRPKAASEICAALADDGVAVVAFPEGEAAARAEQRIADAYRELTGNELRWLAEHAAEGLPEKGEIAQYFQDALCEAHTVRQEKNTPLWLWVWMWKILMCGWPGRGNAMCQAVLRLLTPIFCRLHFGSCYRTLVWIESEKKDKP